MLWYSLSLTLHINYGPVLYCTLYSVLFFVSLVHSAQHIPTPDISRYNLSYKWLTPTIIQSWPLPLVMTGCFLNTAGGGGGGGGRQWQWQWFNMTQNGTPLQAGALPWLFYMLAVNTVSQSVSQSVSQWPRCKCQPARLLSGQSSPSPSPSHSKWCHGPGLLFTGDL